MIVACMLCMTVLADPPPATFVLQTEQNVWDVAVADPNQDGFGDVLALCCDETSYPLDKSLCLFHANGAGAYGEAPAAALPLQPQTGALFLAEVDGTAPQELVAADAGGATVYQYREGRFEVIAEPRFVSLLPSNSKEPLFLKDAAADLDGDGIDEWLIPVATGFAVRHADTLLATVSCDVVSEIRRNDSTYISHRLPACTLFELEGTAHKGLAFLSDEFADFAYGDEWSKRERFRVPVNLEEKWEASAKMADVNKNGFPDLMVTQTKGTINLEALTHVYVAGEPFQYPEQPTASFVSKGAVASPALLDVDGDERLDVLLVSIPFGLKNFMNFFLRGKVSVDVAVYPFNGTDFGSKPAFSTTLTMDAPEGRERVAYTMGDFNGDGRLDVAFGKEDNSMAIHTGEAARFVSARPWVTLNLPCFGVARPYDLSGNPAQDILLFHPGGQNAKRIEVIVF